MTRNENATARTSCYDCGAEAGKACEPWCDLSGEDCDVCGALAGRNCTADCGAGR